MEEGTSHYIPISNVVQRDIPASPSSIFIEPIVIPYPENTKRYIEIKIAGMDLNSVSPFMIHVVILTRQ